MSYTALYRKWRPTVFEDVIGQTHITQTIKNQINSGRSTHAYLFCGTRGTGKTSTAKIFSRAVNCIDSQEGNPCNKCEVCLGILNGSILDVIEIDAASNNGVDNIREIRDEVKYAPSKGKYKVYIIDEVHMLSTGAFNALLKTLEEPPSHVLFILATTEPHKIPATILSRCQRYDFRRISTEHISERLEKITYEDNIDIDKRAIRLVSSFADGSMRDALSILDQCIAFSSEGVTYEEIISILGVVDNSFLFEVAAGIAQGNASMLMQNIDRLVMEGRDINHFFDEFIGHFRNLLVCKVMEDPQKVLDTLPENVEKLKAQSKSFTEEKLVNCVKVLSEAQANAKWLSHSRIVLETAILKLSQPRLDTSYEALIERIAELENKIKNGVVSIENSVNGSDAVGYNVKRNDIHEDNGNPNNKQRGISKKCDSQEDSQKELQEGLQEDIQEGLQEDSKEELGEEPQSASQEASQVDKNKLMSIWPDVINETRKSGKLSLYGFIAGTEVAVKDGMLIILFDDSCSTNKMMIEKAENKEFVKATVNKLYGSEVMIKCSLKKDLSSIKGEPQESPSAKKTKDGLDHIIKLKEEWGDKIEIVEED